MTNIYIVVENANRELYSRFLLIFEIFRKFGKKKVNIVIGEKNEIRKKILNYPKGIIIEKGIQKGSIKIVKKWYNLGHKVLMFDEESISYRDDKQYFGNKFDKNLEKYVDCFFLTGHRQKKTIKKKVKNFKYLLTGSLRVELLKKKFLSIYDDEVSRLKKKFGNYIFITSRFANINYNSTKKLKYNKKIYGNYLSDTKIIFNEFKKLPEKIRERFKNTNIVVRPHPSEDLKVWKKITNNINNCNIKYEGNIIPWILASKLVIHNRCTSGIESFFLNKKTISFDPLFKRDPLNYFFKEIGNNYDSLENLIRNINFKINKKSKKKIIQYFIYNCNKKQSHKIISNFIFNKYHYFKDKNEYQHKLVSSVDLLKLFLGKIFSLKSGYRKYSNQKIGEFNYFQLRKIIKMFSKLKEYKMSEKIKIKQVGKRIFCINKI